MSEDNRSKGASMSDRQGANGDQGYSALAKWLHWLVAPIVLAQIPVGAIMGDLPQGALQDRLFFLHESFGLTVLALMIARIATRLRAAPPAAPGFSRAERITAAATHHSMYLLLALTPVLGWLALSAYGLRPAFFGLFEPPALLAKDEPLSKLLFSLHGLAGFSLAGLIALHLLGVARHAFIKRDGVARRMLPRRN
jgi:cytochrome b561